MIFKRFYWLEGYYSWHYVFSVWNTLSICFDYKSRKMNGTNTKKWTHDVSFLAWQKATKPNKNILKKGKKKKRDIKCMEQMHLQTKPKYVWRMVMAMAMPGSGLCTGSALWGWAGHTPAPQRPVLCRAVQAAKAQSWSLVHGSPCSCKQHRCSLGLEIFMLHPEKWDYL